MKNILKIGHISDTHISRKYYRENIKSLKLLLKEMIKEGVNHIIISGDIVSTAEEEDFLLVREIFLSLGLLNYDRLTVVPGNHDIFGGPHRAIDIVNFPYNIKHVNYEEKILLFKNAFAETFMDVIYADSPYPFPFIKKLDGFDILCMNSVMQWSVFRNPFGTNGNIDSRQYRSLQQLALSNTETNSIKIAVLHHHFSKINIACDLQANKLWSYIEANTIKMRRQRKLLKLFKNIGVRYVLHGHIHKNEIYNRKGILFVNGAGSICDDPVKYLKYNLLESINGYCRVVIRQLNVPYQVSTVAKEYIWKYRPRLVVGLDR